MIQTSIIGFPRIGEKRDLKKAIESFWAGEIDEASLIKSAEKIKEKNYNLQIEHGIDIIPSNDFSLYDGVLDLSVMLGQVPKRYLEHGPANSIQTYFAMARGKGSTPPLEMTKWFDTNYHYTVPELTGSFELIENRPLTEFKWAEKKLGIKTKPVLLGFYTYLKLAKVKKESQFKEMLASLSKIYETILRELDEAGADYVQIDEPALVLGEDSEIVKFAGDLYREISKSKKNSEWILQTYYEDISEHFDEVLKWPFDYLGLDLVRGSKNLEHISKLTGASKKKLALGLVDGRNIWKNNISGSLKTLKHLESKGLLEEAIIQTSCSLSHVPYTVRNEKNIPAGLDGRLAFAVEKLDELSEIKQCHTKDKMPKQESAGFSSVPDPKTSSSLNDLKESDFKRPKPFAERIKMQQRVLNLPLLPTTTIGSFPQTEDLRKVRSDWKKGKMTDEDYKTFIQQEIVSILSLQEMIGLDVLVHGEFERTDMVEFFGEKLKGFHFTGSGWVQSYGSRCVRPPIIFDDVKRTKPMTVDEVAFAQTQTSKHVKGMLTGPVTIVNWSFPRIDIPKKDIAFQIALALREETKDLEKAGIRIIQIDEPAIREGLPLKKSDREDYLDWSVKAFRLASSGVKDETQIHTHMCYSDFNEMIRSIYEMDADVLSIENARSSDELLAVFKEFNYDHQIGPGVYDIHTERIPSASEIEDKIRKVLNHIRKELLWINPDCGLKTRKYPESTKSLHNMVEAARKIRQSLK
jgi:5-methyltetrahydropteroyltriglutamate--homocysteine methyltransferase